MRVESEAPQADEGPPGTSRRLFLTQVAASATIGTLWLEGVLGSGRRAPVEPTRPGAPRRSLDEAQWKTLAAAQQRILPSEPDAPGAREVNAIGYLDAAMADPEIHDEVEQRLKDGAARLDAFARERGVTSFADLPMEAQEEGIRAFEKTPQDQLWLRNMIWFVIEAFFGDPVHGGNPDEIAWKWAHHEAGYPRPKTAEPPRGRGANG